MNTALETLTPAPLWRHFDVLCNTPRPSWHEAAIRARIVDWAEARGLACTQDAAGNLLITQPATAGHEAAPTVALQAHIDMVAEAEPHVVHDFAQDAIRPRVVDGWLMATDTTLGADNGIGVAAALARFRNNRIGFVFQTFNLLPAFTALENVLLGMSFSRGRVDRGRALELLDNVGLGNRLNHRPGQLSVGEQQRVAVARALSNRPSLLLADEPTANVDLANQQTILELIRSACTTDNVALLLVTHSSDVAGQFDRIEQLSDFNTAVATAGETTR